MATVLVVDDNPGGPAPGGGTPRQAARAEGPLRRERREALALIQERPPDLVLTDLHMPEMDGLELVVEVRKNFPLVPVILMTAYGSEEIAIQALQKGAASYVPKRNLAQDLAETTENVLSLPRPTATSSACWNA